MSSLPRRMQYTNQNSQVPVLNEARTKVSVLNYVNIHLWHYLPFIREWILCKTARKNAIILFLSLFYFFFTACSTRSGLNPSPTEPALAALDSGAETTGPESNDESAVQSIKTSYIPAVKVGRALESGDLETARSLASKLDESPAALLVKARIATALKDHETAVRLYHKLTDAVAGFERMRLSLLAEELRSAGRKDEAVKQLEILLKTDRTLTRHERFSFHMKRAEWLLESKKYTESLVVIGEAAKEVSTPAEKDELNSATAKTLLGLEKKQEAATILETAILKSAGRKACTEALALLKEHRLVPNWSEEQKIAVANRLMDFRAFEPATEILASVRSPRPKEEAAWLKAKILFQRRGHYKEALTELKSIAASKGRHTDDAAFLAARALSRLDRDEEAIKAYRTYALNTKFKSKASDARFLAARLEFYLGRHAAALTAFEQLVGKGTTHKTPKSLPDPSDTRDAHFMAGLCALSLGRASRAAPHFTAASLGTKHPEVLQRNSYWSAVATAEMKKKGWVKALVAVCEKDPTDWYARLAAQRLADAKQDPGACALTSPETEAAAPSEATETDGGAAEIAIPSKTEKTPEETLLPISTVVALYTEAGLFRDAARMLREMEKSGAVKLSTAEWIARYTALEAPQYAIAKASAQFRWPPSDESRKLAEAAYPIPYKDLAKEVTNQHELPDLLIFAIARKESLFDPKAVSHVGAMGLMQMMPGTYEANRKRAGLPPLAKGTLPGPEDSLRAAGFEFEALFQEFGSLPLSIMAYNAGAAAVSRWLDRSGGLPLDLFVEKAGFAETRNYVRRVTQNLVRYRYIYGGAPLELPQMVEKKK